MRKIDPAAKRKAAPKKTAGGGTVLDNVMGVVAKSKGGATIESVKAARREEASRAAGILGGDITFLDAGDFFGEMAVFEKEVRSATVRAHGEARVLKIDKRTLLRRIREDPLLAVNLLKTMSHRIRELNGEIARHRETRL